ncbi:MULTISPECIES: hypothetical protein [Actinomycetes]|uniref:hypothetical protein n=1 Tax=Actinomycetes TaxID=1760 RepID=UPI0031D72229
MDGSEVGVGPRRHRVERRREGGGALLRRRLIPLAAVAVVLVEVLAFLGDLGSDPVAFGQGWGPTRSGGLAAWFLLAAVCLPMLGLSRWPTTAAWISTTAYGVAVVTDYAFGLTLPPMLAILVLAARRRRAPAWLLAMAALAATLLWVHRRAVGIIDPEVGVLVWISFGVVSAVFFLGSALVGELIAAHSSRPTVGPSRALSPSDGP